MKFYQEKAKQQAGSQFSWFGNRTKFGRIKFMNRPVGDTPIIKGYNLELIYQSFYVTGFGNLINLMIVSGILHTVVP